MAARLQFGIGIPTGTEGLMYPVPFAQATDNIFLAQAAERLGYDSVWGNDHVSTQHYVRHEATQAPRYYAPLLILAAVGAATRKIKLATALLVVPFRHPVVIAKEVATLDQLTGGRLLLGVGIGAYREEFEAMYGAEQAKKVNRGALLDEALDCLELLWGDADASHRGKYFTFESVQTFPKPVQKPVPIYIGGNAPEGWRRCGRYGQGWLPAVLSPAEVAHGHSEIRRYLEEYGRGDVAIDVAPQLAVSLGKTHEDAMRRFQSSQVYKHLQSLKQSTLKGQQSGTLEERSLIGTPDEVCEQVQRYAEAGVTTFSAMLFANNSVDEFVESMQFFSESVIQRLAGGR